MCAEVQAAYAKRINTSLRETLVTHTHTVPLKYRVYLHVLKHLVTLVHLFERTKTNYTTMIQ